MRKDILGREIKENDIVVVKGNYGCAMEVGVFIGKSVRTMNGPRSAKDMFLVERPGAKELEIKKDILDKMAAEKAAAAIEKAKKANQKADIPGTIYLMSRDKQVFLYCGKCLVSTYTDGNLTEQVEGYFYLPGAHFVGDNPTRIATFDFDHFKSRNNLCFGAPTPQTGVKKYEKAYQQIDIPDEFELVGTWQKLNAGVVVESHTVKTVVQRL